MDNLSIQFHRTITLVKVRRLLEEDLELDKFALDSFKSVIGRTLDEVGTYYIFYFGLHILTVLSMIIYIFFNY